MIAPWTLDEELFAVKISNLHGKGLFALKFFKAGTEFGASIIHKSVAEKYTKFLADQCNQDLKWDFVQTTGARFVNHSKTPNIELYKSELHNGVLCTRCIKDINAGEELTFDYKTHLILAEDCSDLEVIKHYSKILNLSQEEILNWLKNQK
jgi:SET domain-containing protein